VAVPAINARSTTSGKMSPAVVDRNATVRPRTSAADELEGDEEGDEEDDGAGEPVGEVPGP
jgi:hypothetical protein